VGYAFVRDSHRQGRCARREVEMRFYYGWWIVLIAAANMTLVVGATFNIFGLFVRPVSEEFGPRQPRIRHN
jgi:hypothetical protein